MIEAAYVEKFLCKNLFVKIFPTTVFPMTSLVRRQDRLCDNLSDDRLFDDKTVCATNGLVVEPFMSSKSLSLDKLSHKWSCRWKNFVEPVFVGKTVANWYLYPWGQSYKNLFTPKFL